MGNELTLRAYGIGIGDWQTVSGWHQARHGKPLPETILPPLGIMVEDAAGPVAALFAGQYVGIGIAVADFFLTRPGLSLSAAKRVGMRALEGLIAVLRESDYGMLRWFTGCRAFGRMLRSAGFTDHQGVFVLRLIP